MVNCLATRREAKLPPASFKPVHQRAHPRRAFLALGGDVEHDLAVVGPPFAGSGCIGLSHFRSSSGPGLTLVTIGTSCGEDCRHAVEH